MATNALSPIGVIEAFGELVTPAGTIAIMSSGQGSIATSDRGGFEIDDSIPRLVATVDAQRGRAGLQFLDYLGEAVAW